MKQPRLLRLVLPVAALLFAPACNGGLEKAIESEDVPGALDCVDGVTFEEVSSPIEGYRYFYLTITQPADHNAPDGLQFSQRLTLLHRSFEAPLVLYSGGYFVSQEAWLYEPTALLEANQLSVEHRFFEPSRPDPPDWSTLTVEQSADDFHRIVDAFAPLYRAAWIGTGGSKGGLSAIFHRRFYPDDVDGTVAYVAPLSLSDQDPRYVDFLSQIGSEACWDTLVDFQREVLLRRDRLVPMMGDLEEDGLTFDHLGEDRALEYAALEMSWFFWQYYDASWCDLVPGPSSSDEEIFSFLLEIPDLFWFSDWAVWAYEPYFYQAAFELGYPENLEAPLADLLEYPGTDTAEAYLASGQNVDFDAGTMEDISSWVRTQGQRLILVYGTNDPWTAGAIDLGEATESVSLFVDGGNHASKLADLNDDDKDEALGLLEAWTGVIPLRP